MLQKFRPFSFIPKTRPCLQSLPTTTSLSLCFQVSPRRFRRAAPIDDQPAIERAVRKASPELVGMLLDHGADPEIFGREGQSMLAPAVALDRLEVVVTLANRGAGIDTRVAFPALDVFADLFTTRFTHFYLTKDRGLTPLMLAVFRGRKDRVPVLPARNARLDTPTGEHGTWPIGLAVYQENVPMMQLVLGRDPDPTKQPRRILV